jgi:hypothetical protein
MVVRLYFVQSAATIRHLFSEINQRSPFNYVEALMSFQSPDSDSMRKKADKATRAKAARPWIDFSDDKE